jgi:single-strand DNA-binding protein
MADLNQCSFIGRLGADPEIKSFSNGGRIANLRIACGEQWKDKATGEKKERTEWISVTINSDGLVGIAERYLKKGSRVFIQGKLQTRKWQDQSGNDRYSTEIVLGGFGGILTMLDGKQDGQGSGQSQRGQEPATGNGGPGRFGDDLDDDIPFVTCASVW